MSKLSKIVCVVVLYTYSTFSFALDDSQTPQPHRQQYPPYATEEKQNTATGEKNSTDTASKIIRTPSQYLQPYASYCTQQFQSKEQEWLRNFACDIKITDFVVATFTVILVLVTTLLVVVGLCQSRQLSNTVKLARADF